MATWGSRRRAGARRRRTAIGLWGDADQQATYLPRSSARIALRRAGPDGAPARCSIPFALARPPGRPAAATSSTAIKALVPRAGEAELFVVAADARRRRAGAVHRRVRAGGIAVEPDPAMGVRAAATGRLILQDVRVPATRCWAAATADFAECVAARPHGLVRAGRRHRPGRARLRDPVRQRADGVRRADRQPPGGGVRGRRTSRSSSRGCACSRTAPPAASTRAELRPRGRARAPAVRRARAMEIGSDGVQLLGGHGFVKEHPVERWYRDLRAAGVMEGALLV